MLKNLAKDRYSFWQDKLTTDENVYKFIQQRKLILSAAENKRKLEEALFPAVASSIYDELTKALK